ncbi:MAG: hypothetical protein U1E24_14085 [Phenylobacterium sp.]|nr:hypothetical protein [Phenylobacterium sp.]
MIGLLVAAALATAAAEDPPAAEEIQADTLWLMCLIQSTRDMDDGISDAQTIANAVASACDSRWQVVRRELVAKQPRNMQASVFEATEKTPARVALNSVLRVRRQRAEAAQGTPTAPKAEPAN